MPWRESDIPDSVRGLKRLASDLPDLLYPRRCPVCDRIVLPKGEYICPECRSLLSPVKEPVCMKCGKEIQDASQEYCRDCIRHRRSFEYAVSVYNYTETASESLSAVKYKNRRDYLDFYAAEAVRVLGRKLAAMGADCMIPVPVHPKRMRKRGFNQAQILAEKVGTALGIPVEEGFLIRNRNTAPQKILSPAERLRNLEQAFLTAERAPAGMRRVILVDDIYTTGATAEACTRVLKASGVEKVYVFTICVGSGE
ncbi:MAG: ComF family protein [Clostridium sp.]|nr:ComF family protein [Clostridium sp.]